MKSITKLKDKARQHEQKENWQAAIDAYQEVIRADEAQEAEGDLALYNRVGDLYLRLGQSDRAVDYYSQAAEKYSEVGLFNNAIALCNKALRYRPEEPKLYRQLGEYSAEQGFLVDARRWYLDYAERQVKAGAVEEAFEALEDFADLSNDPEVREMLADQLASHERPGDAAVQLRKAYTERVQRGQQEAAAALAERLQELDPTADLAALEAEAAAAAAESERAAPEPEEPDELAIETTAAEPVSADEVATDTGLEIEHTALGGAAAEADVEPAADEAVSGLEVGYGEREVAEAPAEAAGGVGDLETFEETAAPDEAEEEEEAGAEPLPMLDEEEPAGAVEDLPGFEGAGPGDEEEPEEAEEFEGEEAEEEAEPLPLMGMDEVGVAGEAEEVAEELPGLDIGDMSELGGDAPEDSDAAGFDLGALDLSFAGGDQAGGAVAEAAEELEAPSQDVDTASVLDRSRELVSRGLNGAALSEMRLLLVVRAEPKVYEDALAIVAEMVRQDPDDLAALQRRVELAARMGDRDVLAQTYLDLAGCLVRKGAETKAATVFHRVLDIDPANQDARDALGISDEPDEGAEDAYVDLAAFLDADAAVAAAASASVEGSDDFADLFSQFKAKVTEDVAVEDAGSHYDLGLAFKEMGLIDEAITEFQTALRGGEERLKVYEELGQCFVMKSQFNVAVKVLARALELPREDDAELLGVYYHLGLCHEELGDRGEARAAYDRIMELDPSFRDVPERLSRL